jgi:hypothetical protein
MYMSTIRATMTTAAMFGPLLPRWRSLLDNQGDAD